jgi:hypothetical protein
MSFSLRSEKQHGRPLTTYVTAALFFTTVIGFLYYFFALGGHSAAQWTPCGQSPAEARERGCHFEPMMSAWIPDACYFPELVAEYEEMDDIWSTWEWYTDVNLEQSVTDAAALQNLREGNYTKIWTSRDHAHDLHCLYAWRKINMALERKFPLIDARSLEFHHSMHCSVDMSAYLREKADLPWGRKPTRWPMLYHDCVPLLN